MDSKILGLRIAGTIFGLISFMHFLRILTSVELQVAGYLIPQWLSAPAFVFFGWLSLWMWKSSID